MKGRYNNMEIYARQVNPEYQESPLYTLGIEECYPDSIIMPGNRNFRAHNTDMTAWEQITRYFDEMAQEWNDDGRYYEYDPEENRYTVIYTKKQYTLAEILTDYKFFRPDGKPWTNKQKHAFRLLMEDEEHSAEDEEIYFPLLNLLTGYTWEKHTIRGSSQSDWADVITRADVFTPEVLAEFEAEYFNTGTEWIIHDGETAPEGPEDIDGFSTYCTEWDDEKTRQHIRNAYGASPDDEVILYKWAGYTQIPRYEKV